MAVLHRELFVCGYSTAGKFSDFFNAKGKNQVLSRQSTLNREEWKREKIMTTRDDRGSWHGSGSLVPC